YSYTTAFAFGRSTSGGSLPLNAHLFLSPSFSPSSILPFVPYTDLLFFLHLLSFHLHFTRRGSSSDSSRRSSSDSSRRSSSDSSTYHHMSSRLPTSISPFRVVCSVRPLDLCTSL